ncbi:hypothetical protein [Amycolatopsis saalfeldensis]|uniref:hypothetical protein n=1 Tax=Amycolatopsis saalfeldensis TaxID=394193 RepID=UPI003CCC2089
METITATYLHDDEDWTITVNGRGKELSAKAPGIIAARDRADQLVEQVAPDGRPTVVHLLNGSALEFTSTYMTARLTLPEIEPLQVPPAGTKPPAAAPAGDAPTGSAAVDPAVDGSASAESGAKPATAPVDPATPSSGSSDDSTATPAPADGSTADPVSVPGQASARSVKPQLPSSKQLSKEVGDRKPEAPSRPGIPASASAKPPAARA